MQIFHAPRWSVLLLGLIAAACGGRSTEEGECCSEEAGQSGSGHGSAGEGGTRQSGAGQSGAGQSGAGQSGAGQSGASGFGTGVGEAGTGEGGMAFAVGGAAGAGAPDERGGSAGEGGLAGAGGSSDACPQRSGLVAWWPGEGNASDALGGGPGTLQGGVAFVSGRVGQAFSFDGADDVINLGNAPKLRVSATDFTIEAWVRFDSHQGDMSIADKMGAIGVNSDGWRLLKQADDRFWFCFGGGAQNGCTPDPSSTVYSTTSVVSDVWFHVAVVKTSTNFALYVNGKLEDQRSPVPAFVDTHSTDLLLGAYAYQGNGAPAYLDGSIDEAKLFNRALTAQEISLDFDAGTAGECGSDRPTETGDGTVGALACSGEGLVYVLPDECMADGGYSGINDVLEVYCCGGISRFCLSGESCPWRTGCTADSATCSRGGLASDYMANAWCSEWKAHADYYCGQDGQIRFTE